MKEPKVIIIDYGLGNLRSVEKGLQYVGVPSKVSGDIGDIEEADAIILPGVGAFESGMSKFAPLKDAVIKKVKGGTPLFGICLGMQMLFEESEENGLHKGLGLVPGRVTRFSGDLKVPHMGWNSLTIDKRHPVLEGISDGAFVYFVHSYRAGVNDCTVASTDYGGMFSAMVASGENVVGTQFHPEKSGETGLRMLKNFAGMING